MAWQILTGVVEWFADEGLRDVGRRRRAGATRGRGVSGEPIPRGTIDAARAAFIAQRKPWRLTELTLDDTSCSGAPAIASWADDATAVLAGSPAQQRIVGPNESWGDLSLRAMLEPAALSALIPEPWEERFQLDGRLLEGDPALMPALLTWSANRYDIVYDRHLAILTSWTAIIDDNLAQRTMLSQVTTLDLHQ